MAVFYHDDSRDVYDMFYADRRRYFSHNAGHDIGRGDDILLRILCRHAAADGMHDCYRMAVVLSADGNTQKTALTVTKIQTALQQKLQRCLYVNN